MIQILKSYLKFKLKFSNSFLLREYSPDKTVDFFFGFILKLISELIKDKFFTLSPKIS